MKIRDILRQKGSGVVTVTPDRTVLEAIGVLVHHNIGAVVVVDAGDVQGILTERDVLRLSAREPGALGAIRVGDVMTTELVIGLPEDDLGYAMDVMTKNRIRHLPIIEDGTLFGILSIGDVVNAARTSVEAENRYLRDYIQGVAG